MSDHELNHNEQCQHIDEHIDNRLYKHNEEIKEFIITRLSSYESSLMKEILSGNKATEEVGKRVSSLEEAISNYKFGWKVFTFIGGAIVGAVYLLIELMKFKITR